MRHQTFSARWHKKNGTTKAGLLLESVRQLRERRLGREKLDAHASAGGWTEGKQEVWLLKKDGELLAEVAKIHTLATFVAIIWRAHSHVEWDKHISVLNGMRWCDERLRAVTLNARVDAERAAHISDGKAVARYFGQNEDRPARMFDGSYPETMHDEHLQHGQ